MSDLKLNLYVKEWLLYIWTRTWSIQKGQHRNKEISAKPCSLRLLLHKNASKTKQRNFNKALLRKIYSCHKSPSKTNLWWGRPGARRSQHRLASQECQQNWRVMGQTKSKKITTQTGASQYPLLPTTQVNGLKNNGATHVENRLSMPLSASTLPSTNLHILSPKLWNKIHIWIPAHHQLVQPLLKLLKGMLINGVAKSILSAIELPEISCPVDVPLKEVLPESSIASN